MYRWRLFLNLHQVPDIVFLAVYVYICTYMYFQDVKKWLEEVVVELQNCESPKSQFVSSVCIACCSVAVDCYQRDLKLTKFVYPLLKMLHIQPNVENRSCPKVSYLFDIITTKKFRY